MRYVHVDVFSDKPLGGNGLAVAFLEREIDTARMQQIAREFNQFETAFVGPEVAGSFPVRIFTVDEELPFAGHPLLGSAAAIHREFYPKAGRAAISIALGNRFVALESVLKGDGETWSVLMNQGSPDFVATLDAASALPVARSLALDPADLDPAYPLEVVSTGLPYLLVPLRSALERARIVLPDFESFLSRFGAKFAYLFDTATLECRTWDNSGRVEDSATGSAAGPLAAYLVKNGHACPDSEIILSQGRFTGRPARIECRLSGGEVFVRGDVAFFAEGKILL